MGEVELRGRLGLLLQGERARAGITQRQLAGRAGVEQAWVCRVERGKAAVRVRDVERLFAALGVRLVVAAVGDGGGDPAVVDADVVRGGEGAVVLHSAVSVFRPVLTAFAGVPHLLGGRFAALAQGLPVVPGWVDVVVAGGELDAVRRVMGGLPLRRWCERWQEFRGFDPDPGGEGPRRWSVAGLCELRVEVVGELPVGVGRVVGDVRLGLVPLGVLLERDGDVAAVARRVAGQPGRRVRSASATDQA